MVTYLINIRKNYSKLIMPFSICQEAHNYDHPCLSTEIYVNSWNLKSVKAEVRSSLRRKVCQLYSTVLAKTEKSILKTSLKTKGAPGWLSW